MPPEATDDRHELVCVEGPVRLSREVRGGHPERWADGDKASRFIVVPRHFHHVLVALALDLLEEKASVPAAAAQEVLPVTLCANSAGWV
jgi:hypothetical protein